MAVKLTDKEKEAHFLTQLGLPEDSPEAAVKRTMEQVVAADKALRQVLSSVCVRRPGMTAWEEKLSHMPPSESIVFWQGFRTYNTVHKLGISM